MKCENVLKLLQKAPRGAFKRLNRSLKRGGWVRNRLEGVVILRFAGQGLDCENRVGETSPKVYSG